MNNGVNSSDYFIYDGQTQIPHGTTHLKTTHDFNDTITLPSSITHLRFGSCYNQPTNNLPNSITHLTFGKNYNCITDDLPNSITHLTFGYHYNQPISTLPPLITHLTFGDLYNQPTNELPSSITHLTFGCFYNQPTNNLPPQCTYLALGLLFDSAIIFPSSITNVYFRGRYDRYIKSLCKNNNLMYTNIQTSMIKNHIEKNKNNVVLKSLTLLSVCIHDS